MRTWTLTKPRTLWITACLAATSGCSMERSDQSSVRVDLGNREFTPGSLALLSPDPGGLFVTAPASINAFECFAVNVFGPDIPNHNGAPFQKANPASCRYMGFTSSLIAGEPTGSVLEVFVPPGGGRYVQVVGVVTAGLSCDLFRNLQDAKYYAEKNGLFAADTFGFFHVGGTLADIYGDTTVTINSSYNPAAAQTAFNCFGGGDYNQLIIGSSGLRGYWPLDEVSSGAALDLSSYGTDGAHAGSTVFMVAPAVSKANPNGAIDTSTSGTMTVVNNPTNYHFIALEPFTIEVWIKFTGGCASAEVLATSAHSTPPYNEYGFDCDPSGVRFFANDSALGAADSGSFNGVTVNNGSWHHLAGVFDGTNMHLYVDGSHRTQNTGSIAAAIQPSNGLRLQRPYTSYDEFAVYNRALSAAEILERWSKHPLGYRDHAVRAGRSEHTLP